MQHLRVGDDADTESVRPLLVAHEESGVAVHRGGSGGHPAAGALGGLQRALLLADGQAVAHARAGPVRPALRRAEETGGGGQRHRGVAGAERRRGVRCHRLLPALRAPAALPAPSHFAAGVGVAGRIGHRLLRSRHPRTRHQGTHRTLNHCWPRFTERKDIPP